MFIQYLFIYIYSMFYLMFNLGQFNISKLHEILNFNIYILVI